MAATPAGELKVVARFLDGRVMKGTTLDFSPDKPRFHILSTEGSSSPGAMEVALDALKALFFVKSHDGEPGRKAEYTFHGAIGTGRKATIVFTDGEGIAGFAIGFSTSKPGFFLTVVDSKGNNRRAFILRKAVRKVEWMSDLPLPAQPAP